MTASEQMMATAATERPEIAQQNPLTAGLERLPVAPTALVIFGATGDLARRKLLPALYNLAHEGALPEHFHLVGVARRERDHEDYRLECEQAIRRFSRREPDEDVLKALLEHVKYVPGCLTTTRSTDGSDRFSTALTRTPASASTGLSTCLRRRSSSE